LSFFYVVDLSSDILCFLRVQTDTLAGRKVSYGARKANDAGEDVGTVFVNADQTVTITAGPSATKIQMADGRTRWVKETAEQVAVLVKTPA